MSTLTLDYAHGKNGNISGVGLDSSAVHKFKPSAYSLQFDVDMENVGGYGDGGFDDWCCGTVAGSVAISGWVLNSGAPHIPNCEDSITLLLTVDTGKTYSGAFVVRTTRLDSRYKKCTPFFLSGMYKRVVTETWT